MAKIQAGIPLVSCASSSARSKDVLALSMSPRWASATRANGERVCDEGPLARLLGNRSARLCDGARVGDPTARAFDLAEHHVDVRERALVAELARGGRHRVVGGESAVQVAVPEADTRRREQRLAQNGPVETRVLKRDGGISHRAGVEAPERRRGHRLRGERLGLELRRTVAARSVRGRPGYVHRLGQPLAQAEERPGKPLLSVGLAEGAALGLGHRLAVESGGTADVIVVRPEPRESHEQRCPRGPLRRAFAGGLDEAESPLRVAGAVVIVRRLHQAAAEAVVILRGRERCSPLEQERRRPRRSSRSRVPRGVFEHGRDGRVGLLDGSGELPRTSLRLLEELGEPRMDLAPAQRIGGLVGPGDEQRMREADPLAFELHDPCIESRSEDRRSRSHRRPSR